jgi:ribonuclease HI
MTIIYFDGGCKPNPGNMSAGIILTQAGQIISTQMASDLGWGTNNVAEWSALVWAATYADEQGLDNLIFRGDSQLVVNQVLGKYRCNEALRPWLDAYRTLAFMKNWQIEHVLRDKNLAGVYMEEHGL